MKKYKLIKTDERLPNGEPAYRIKALIDIPKHSVKKGDLGGLVQSDENLSHDGSCWIGDDAKVYGDAEVYEYAIVAGYAKVSGDANIHGNAKIHGNARVYGSVEVDDMAKVYGNARICGGALLSGNADVSGSTVITVDAIIKSTITSTKDYLCIGPFGHNNRFITATKDEYVAAGCFFGTFNEFKEAVLKKYGKNYGGSNGYEDAIKMITLWLKNK